MKNYAYTKGYTVLYGLTDWYLPYLKITKGQTWGWLCWFVNKYMPGAVITVEENIRWDIFDALYDTPLSEKLRIQELAYHQWTDEDNSRNMMAHTMTIDTITSELGDYLRDYHPSIVQYRQSQEANNTQPDRTHGTPIESLLGYAEVCAVDLSKSQGYVVITQNDITLPLYKHNLRNTNTRRDIGRSGYLCLNTISKLKYTETK